MEKERRKQMQGKLEYLIDRSPKSLQLGDKLVSQSGHVGFVVEEQKQCVIWSNEIVPDLVIYDTGKPADCMLNEELYHRIRFCESYEDQLCKPLFPKLPSIKKAGHHWLALKLDSSRINPEFVVQCWMPSSLNWCDSGKHATYETIKRKDMSNYVYVCPVPEPEEILKIDVIELWEKVYYGKS